MMFKTILMSAMATAVLVGGVALGGSSSTALARSRGPQTSRSVETPAALVLEQSASSICRFVSCRDDHDCAISSLCRGNGCSVPPDPGDGFGRCTVVPQ